MIREGGNGMKGERGCTRIHSGVAWLGPNKLKKEYIDLVRVE
uniref:Uncharacterized protein n=1 Tax=Candidatus Methanophaga sp. ANME-1 ERB7 TaxID=2759913 RepID=A0A7G9Z5Q0_9EURY|nr:hypothetical protein BJEEAEJC_00027 [Methanosarcinales archaeon ANME-1 ERB7]